ncbi:hypothetical protein DFJ63DRAFT_337207 [Scheffersomyces coipomensis]|uniref:uncharacterized protein n=1 Tax=Scheffersomyces coipomensis TaxID=1788519 RepID=UPI00315CA9C0
MEEGQRITKSLHSSVEEATKEEDKQEKEEEETVVVPIETLPTPYQKQQHQQQLLDTSSFIAAASSPSFNMSFTSQAFDSSDVTDIDIDPELFSLSQPDPKPPISIFELIGKKKAQTSQAKPIAIIENETIPPVQNETKIRPPSNLMSILTGNKKKKEIDLSESASPIVTIPQHEPTPTLPDPIELEDSEISDTSFTESKSLELRRDFDVRELEKKMYNNNDKVKSISAKDLFSRLKKKDEPKVIEVESSNPPEIIDLESETILSGDNKGKDNLKRTTAKDIFKSFKPPASVKANKKTTLLVTFKINSDALRQIEKYNNPLITRGNNIKSGSGTNDFFTPPPPSSSTTKTKSLFDSMMQASKKLSPFQSLKELNPTPITKDLMHVFSHEDDVELINKPFQCPWSIRSDQPHIIHLENEDRSDIFKLNPDQSSRNTSISSTTDIDITKLIQYRIPDIEEEPQLNSIYERFIITKQYNKDQLWTDLFQPPRVEDLLMSTTNQNSIKYWIHNAFLRLKNQNLKNPRNVLLKQKKRRDKLQTNFIVDDSIIYDDDETDEDVFVPLLILEGSAGSGKSSSIYTAMKEIDGYVHEINSGSHRGRKDIYNGLKEFCTTQLVHQHKGKKEFQQGLVLFEDVDVLFEQDKNFWLTVQDILNISRKPIVLTCESLQSIPKNMIEYASEEDSVIYIDHNRVSFQLLSNYLWLCCLSQGYQVSDVLISDIINHGFNGVNYDIRKCIMECQFLCSVSSSSNEIVNIGKAIKPTVTDSIEFDLSTIASQIECASAGDVIASNSYSVFNHTVADNELPEVCNIDESLYLRHPTLPIELNIGHQLRNNLSMNLDVPIPKFSYRYLRETTAEFIGSRSKKLPKFIQELSFTRRTLRRNNSPALSSIDDANDYRTPEPTGIPDTSFLNYITPTSLIIDLLPFCRYWVEFQNILNAKEEEQLASGHDSIKRYLNYRDFQTNTTTIRKTLTRSMQI